MEEVFRSGKIQDVSRWEQIDTANSVYFIQSGAIGLFANSKNGQKLLFAYKQHEVFPLTPLIRSNSSGRSYIFKALISSKISALPVKTFNTIVTDPKHANAFAQSCLELIQHQIERIDNLQEENILQRLIERLIYLCSRFGVDSSDVVEIVVPMSHVSIATSINTTRETVNRLMKKLEDEGLVTVRKQRIRVNSFTNLLALQVAID